MTSISSARAPRRAPNGVRDPRRLAAVAQAELEGHLGDAALNAVVATLRIGCRVPIAVVNVVTQDAQTYPAEVGIGTPCTSVPDALSFCSEVVDTKSPLIVVDATTHPAYSENPMVLAGVVRAYAGFPLVDDGHVLGSVSIFDPEPRVFTMDELAMLAHQARLASSVLALRRSVRTDVLTHTPNRRSLMERLAVAIARAGRQDDDVAVLHLDLDAFRTVNEERGQAFGDQVLVALTQRWQEALRPTDTLARVGGDEFVAVCGDLTTDDQARAIAKRLISATSELVVAGEAVPLTVSIGIVLASTGSADPARLVDEAEAAARLAKATPGSAWSMPGSNS